MSLENITYSNAIAELESLVRKMQDENCDIDHLADYTRRSIELLQICRKKLTETDEELKKCLESLDSTSSKAPATDEELPF